jgi:hypothetical protein
MRGKGASHKRFFMILSITLGALVIGVRFIAQRWIFLFGMTSIIIFGFLHFSFMQWMNQHFDDFDKRDKISAYVGVVSFLLIFLFQFDFGDQPGTFYVYEFFSGESELEFKHHAYIIAIFGALVYLMNYFRMRIMIKAYK